MSKTRKAVSYLIAPKIPSEYLEQVKVVTYLEKRGCLVFAIPNGGKRSMTDAVKQKRMGLMAGVPDLMVPMPRDGYHGLFIELKRADKRLSKVTDNQLFWLDILASQGYKTALCYGFDDAKRVIDSYFGF